MMEGTKKTRIPAKKKISTDSTKKTQKKTLGGVGEEKLVVEIGLYVHVDLLNYWGKWKPQYLVVDRFMQSWIICEHWYSKGSNNENISQLGVPLIVKPERLRISGEKCNRPLPWDWYKSIEDMVKFMKSRVGGIGELRHLDKTEQAAYKE